jgi:F0F1-type ATP synthase membrane subunit c/vacuolar-type H+-ATPase subunit K
MKYMVDDTVVAREIEIGMSSGADASSGLAVTASQPHYAWLTLMLRSNCLAGLGLADAISLLSWVGVFLLLVRR